MKDIFSLKPASRIEALKAAMLAETRRVSVEQAAIITDVYEANPGDPPQLLRAKSLSAALDRMSIRITSGELIVGNRTAGVRGGVVFPEAGISWVAKELDTLPTRPQDSFDVMPEDAAAFRDRIEPFWRGRSLEDRVRRDCGELVDEIGLVVKINQKDHAQGHICPDTKGWLELGPAGLLARAKEKLAQATLAQATLAQGTQAQAQATLAPAKLVQSAQAQAQAALAPAHGMPTRGTQTHGMQTHGTPTQKTSLDDAGEPNAAKWDGNAKMTFYRSVVIVLEAASRFMLRYAALAESMAADAGTGDFSGDLLEVARICRKLASAPAGTFHEAAQSLWFLYVILHMESNASSFSPGRMDQYLYPYYRRDIDAGAMDDARALEITECLWLKFNQIVYLRNAHSAKYFAGFPIGFNVAVGGQTADGRCAANELSYLFLKAQEDLLLPQPNLSARLFEGSEQAFVEACSRVIGKGSGMPQIFNDRSIIPALERQGISHEDATNYAIVGCVELTTHGNNLGWSDAAMFNMVKALELAINGGRCLLTGKCIGPDLGSLDGHGTYEELEAALAGQVDHFTEKMIEACEAVERIHQQTLPSPFLSCVISDCIEKGVDVTAGGARYNLSGIQVIQPANIADSLAAVKRLAYDEKRVSRSELLEALRSDFEGREPLRQLLLNGAPKYGNDNDEADLIAAKWVEYFAKRLEGRKNYRGGPYHAGLYTVSAHVPMGQNVGATPDGRKARDPLADGGMSAVYGRDAQGPTSLLKSVSKIDSKHGSNGTLLNMKFLPSFFATEEGITKFAGMLRALVMLKISHAQFNVVNREDLLAAQTEPEKHRNITIRVAGYTAYFTELARDLQDEIIARTSYGDVA